MKGFEKLTKGFKNPIGRVMSKAKDKSFQEKGFRSGFEETVYNVAVSKNLDLVHEPYKIVYVRPAQESYYVPDFILPNGVIIETKGYMPTAERKKFLCLRKYYPGIDIRFIFQNSNLRLERSKTTYGQWCDRHGFLFSENTIPEEWWLESDKETHYEIKQPNKR